MGKVKEKSLFDEEELIPNIKPMEPLPSAKKSKKNGTPEFIYKIICSGSGLRIFKFKIGSVTSKNYIYQNGQNSVRFKKEDIEAAIISEPSYEKSHNACVIHTLKDIENNKDERISLSRLAVSSYRNYINEYIKEYKAIDSNIEKIGIDLLMDKMDVTIREMNN